jgi:hypothetical protein
MNPIEGESLRWSAERRAETWRRKRNERRLAFIGRVKSGRDRTGTEREEDREPDDPEVGLLGERKTREEDRRALFR